MSFGVADEVVWLFWPPSARYRYWQRVDGVVVKVGKRITIQVERRNGEKILRHVDRCRLMSAEGKELLQDHRHAPLLRLLVAMKNAQGGARHFAGNVLPLVVVNNRARIDHVVALGFLDYLHRRDVKTDRSQFDNVDFFSHLAPSFVVGWNSLLALLLATRGTRQPPGEINPPSRSLPQFECSN